MAIKLSEETTLVKGEKSTQCGFFRYNLMMVSVNQLWLLKLNAVYIGRKYAHIKLLTPARFKTIPCYADFILSNI